MHFSRPSLTGSSPRVRGTPRRGGAERRGGRFIPACAGNARGSSARVRPSTVHPRVCGERLSVAGGRWPVAGGRFIPACAGNAQPCRTPWKQSPVHPRVCGERRPRHHAHAQDAGSSPRVRGTPRGLPLPIDYGRFIPACAGNAWAASRRARRSAVHPRVCGERRVHALEEQIETGSSPRMRGTPQPRQRRRRRHRFIPACAGNAARAARARCWRPVHPRVCGERFEIATLIISATGSSPRVRGTLQRRHVGDQQRRFIPACAGNARRASTATSRPSVHPRVCGERGERPASSVGGDGSSPRVRGTPAIR